MCYNPIHSRNCIFPKNLHLQDYTNKVCRGFAWHFNTMSPLISWKFSYHKTSKIAAILNDRTKVFSRKIKLLMSAKIWFNLRVPTYFLYKDTEINFWTHFSSTAQLIQKLSEFLIAISICLDVTNYSILVSSKSDQNSRRYWWFSFRCYFNYLTETVLTIESLARVLWLRMVDRSFSFLAFAASL